GRGGDHRSQRSDDAPDAGRVREVRLHRTDGPEEGEAELSPGADGNGRGSSAALPGDLFRSEYPALPREAAGRAPDRTELHVGATGAAGSRTGGQAAETGAAPAAPTETSVAGNATAHRWQQASLAE